MMQRPAPPLIIRLSHCLRLPLLLALLGHAAFRVSGADERAPNPVGHVAPVFRLRDLGNRPHSLSAYRGRAVVVWFFCGCARCADCAHAWAQMQRSGALHSPTANARRSSLSNPISLVVFAGGRDEARAFAGGSLLDTRQTNFLADADHKVTLDAYHAVVCPRVFVLDSRGIVRYTNDHPADAPPLAPAEAIVAQTLTALRALPVPVAPQTPRVDLRRVLIDFPGKHHTFAESGI